MVKVLEYILILTLLEQFDIKINRVKQKKFWSMERRKSKSFSFMGQILVFANNWRIRFSDSLKKKEK